MRKTILVLLCFLWVGQALSAPPLLKMGDIPKVMERFFALHIENKELSPTLIRRAMKLYVEQFDGEKAYLLEDEVKPFLQMSDKRAKEIMGRLQNHNYSDFIALNGLMQDAVVRSQALRVLVAKELINGSMSFEVPNSLPNSQFAKTEAELAGRQKARMVRFFAFQKTRTNLDTPDRKSKAYVLFEKKVRRSENNYLFLTADDAPMEASRIENLLTMRILKCLAKSLDTHTSFFSPEEAYEMRMSLEKQFEGIGVVLSESIDGVMIAELIKGSPAEQSGQIQINDVLVEIDGIPTANASFEEVLEMLKRKDKGEIILGFKRAEAKNENFFRVPLLKRPIVMNEERIQTSYEKMGNGIIGKITLGSFYESNDGVSSEKDVKEAIRSFREKGNLIGLVLDLRENSGGFLSQAVKVAGLFVSNGVIVISKYGKGEVHFLRNIVSKSYYNGPLVILTSKMSASASEIVAQALQDYGVGLVVGDQRTFGKGSIQYQTVTDANAEIFFKVTVGRYYTVSGKSTQIDGVIADIVVPTVYAPYKIGEKYLEYPLPPDQVAAAYVDPLTDLDEKTQRLFQARYLPYTQRVVSFWKKMLPDLRKNSAYRMAHDPDFRAFLEKQQATYARIDSLPVNTIDEQAQIGKEDLQMNEAVNIVKDMIIMEAESHQPAAELSPTGSE
ncbi:MAG TPA: S41 family peptidase [Chlamydiales bacterium]|nr:S41 family peptidase [Chlamydiales bacterium]